MTDGATMCGYGIDINGVIVDGVVVEKEKARKVFEQEARKTVEKPTVSIAEQTVGNVFKTRVNPLPKRANRTIRVSYIEEITVDEESVAHYDLPLDFDYPIETYNGSVQVDIMNGGVPYLKSDFFDANMKIDTTSQSLKRYSMSSLCKTILIKTGIIVTVPNFQQKVVIEKDEENDIFFSINHPVSSSEYDEDSPRQEVKRLAILWDSSKSRAYKRGQTGDDEMIISELLQQIFPTVVDVTLFRDSPEPTTTFPINQYNDIETLLDFLRNINYDGATNLGALTVKKTTPWEDVKDWYSYYLLFTDGFENLGSKNIPDDLQAPVYAFSSTEKANHTLLKIWALNSGGAYHKLYEDKDYNTIANSIGKQSYSLLSSEYDKNIVLDVYPQVPTSVQGKGSLKIAGKMDPNSKATSATITLNFGYGTFISKQVFYELQFSSAPKDPGELVVRFWAQRKIDHLQLFPDNPNSAEEITKLGRKYSLVTPNTSIIVLEELKQFLQYEITPPVSLPLVRAQYLSIIKEREKEKKRKRRTKNIRNIITLE